MADARNVTSTFTQIRIKGNAFRILVNSLLRFYKKMELAIRAMTTLAQIRKT